MDPKKTQRLDEQTLAQINERDRALRALDYVPARLTRVLGAQDVSGDEIRLELAISRRALQALISADVVASPPPLPAQAPQPQALDQRSTAMMTPHDLERALIASSEPQHDPESTVSFSQAELLAMGVGSNQPEQPEQPTSQTPSRQEQKTINIKELAFSHLLHKP